MRSAFPGFVLAAALAWLPGAPAGVAASGVACESDADCGALERCDGLDVCGAGVCTPAFTLSRFPLEAIDVDAYTADLIAVLDHSGEFFYTQCCDTRITSFTGESVDRGPGAICPVAPVLPACFLQTCTCAYRDPDERPFVINGHYVAGSLLFYDGHAGYDYLEPDGTSIRAPRGGLLCKAEEDPINGRAGAATAWDEFHTFYIDHGTFDGHGWSTWYLHASDLDGRALDGRELRALLPGECAEVAQGQGVALLGNVGTLLPHLHFEVRRYVPGDGPEARSARIIDPYGWRGDGPDPLAANPWAIPQVEPAWVACGNGRVECGEDCDDGNTVDDDGCSSRCELSPLHQCQDELASVQAELDECRDELRDADADGETDASDRCPDTAAGAQVDEAGCSRAQFCANVPSRGWTGRLRCLVSDWRNDEPLLRLPRDCRRDGRNGACAAQRSDRRDPLASPGRLGGASRPVFPGRSDRVRKVLEQ